MAKLISKIKKCLIITIKLRNAINFLRMDFVSMETDVNSYISNLLYNYQTARKKKF